MNKFSATKREFSKINFVEAVNKFISPNVYLNEDITLSGTGINPISQLINSHLKCLGIVTSIAYVSALDSDNQYSAMDNISGMSQFFIKQNELTNIDANKFEQFLLLPINKSFRDFSTSSAFETYLEASFLPSCVVNDPTIALNGVGTDASAKHEYLLNNLGWLYILNSTGTAGSTFAPSSLVRDLLVDKLYRQKKIETVEGIKIFQEYVFHNYNAQSYWRTAEVLPQDFLTSSYLNSTGTYTSGTQQLDKLKTLIEVVYSPLKVDEQDFTVKNAIDDYISANTLLTDETSKGPHYSLMRLLSYGYMDIQEDLDRMMFLYNIDECPDEYLPELANLIGWRLYGYDPNKWRVQLANAVDIYKRSGTKVAIQTAVNSVFSEGVFDVSSSITELWESYIPHLAYYALATESVDLSSFNVWTRDKAEAMGVSGYSSSSMDENLRLCVDAILLRMFEAYPGLFFYGSTKFPVDNPEFIFNYRGRDYPIPPFEEYLYYINCRLTDQLIDKFQDELACFGVPSPFAIQVGDYVRNNSVRAYDDIRYGNTFLLLTSSVNIPPNWGTIIEDVSNKRPEFLSLWSGKSSHYCLNLEATSFDFSKSTLNIDGKLAPIIAFQAGKDFSPAHAIQKSNLFLRNEDDYTTSSVRLVYLDLKKKDFSIGSVSASINNRIGYGASMPASFSRGQVDDISDYDSFMFDTTAVLALRRNSLRRRDYRHLLPVEGFYTRTGFNGPRSWWPDSSVSAYQALGYIPSAHHFLGVSDHVNLPDVYKPCANLGSSSVFSGVTASATFPIRGLRKLGSDAKHTQYSSSADYYIDRNQLDPIIATMHSIGEKRKYALGVSAVSALWPDYVASAGYQAQAQSWANSLTNASGGFPNSMEDYFHFEFSRGLHKLYDDYAKYFARHHFRNILDLSGPTIMAHTFGSALRNSDFDKLGKLQDTIPSLQASSTSAMVELKNGASLFAGTEVATYDSVIHADVTSVMASSMEGTNPPVEIRNAHALSGVEMVQTSGASLSNSFSLVKLDKSLFKKDQDNYLINKPLIKLKAINGLPRLKYSLRTYQNPSHEGYDTTANLLIPNHDFSFKVKYSGATSDGKKIGGVKIGVWIHTQEEGRHIWCLNRHTCKWEYILLDDLSKDRILSDFTFIDSLKEETRSSKKKKTKNNNNCLETFKPKEEKDVISLLGKDDFKEFEIKFNTKNKEVYTPDLYFRTFGQLHRTDQDYIFEVFMIPSSSNKNKFSVLEHVVLRDDTNYHRTKLPVADVTRLSVVRNCGIPTINLTQMELLKVIKYWNEICGKTFRQGYASRNHFSASSSNSTYELSGGSRANYVLHPNNPQNISVEPSSLVSAEVNETIILDGNPI